MKKYFSDLCTQLGAINICGLFGLFIVNDRIHRSPKVKFPPYLLLHEDAFVAEWRKLMREMDPQTIKLMNRVERSKKFNLFIGKYLRFVGGVDMIPSLFVCSLVINPDEYLWN